MDPGVAETLVAKERASTDTTRDTSHYLRVSPGCAVVCQSLPRLPQLSPARAVSLLILTSNNIPKSPLLWAI